MISQFKNYKVYRRHKLRHAFRLAFGFSPWKAAIRFVRDTLALLLIAYCLSTLYTYTSNRIEKRLNVSLGYQKNLESLAKTCLTGGSIKIGQEYFIVDKPISIGEYK